MSIHESGKIQLSEPIGAAVDIESHLFSTSSGDFYRVIDRSDGSSICLWLLRTRLLGDAANDFLTRLSKIEDLRLANCPLKGFGVDSEGRGFALFPHLDAGSVISGNLDAREAERRFAPCLQCVERLHQAGIVVGDLCSNSFLVDRSGRVLFIGVLGSFPGQAEEDGEAAPLPPEILQFMAPEQKAGQVAETSSDVFALGVLGYRLFGGKFPFIGSSPVPPLISAGTSIPAWCNEAFIKCLHESPSVRYGTAGELSLAIQTLRQKALFNSEAPIALNRQLSQTSSSKFQIRQDSAFTYKPLEDRKKTDPLAGQKSNFPKWTFFAGLGILGILCLFVLFYGGRLFDPVQVAQQETNEELTALQEAGTDPKMKAAIEVISQKKSSLEARAQKLQELGASDDPLAHEVIIASAVSASDAETREIAEKAVLERIKRLGGARTAEQLRQWLRTVPAGPLPEVYEPLLKVSNPRQPLAAREALLRQAYPKDAKAVLRFAAAIALDSPNPQDYQAVLAQLVGDSLDLKEADKRSALSLLLAQPEIAAIYGEDVLIRKAELPNSDLPWVLSLLASRNDLNIRQFAQLTLERGQLTPLRRVFLEAVKEREDLSLEIIISLVRAGAGTVSSEDIAQFGRWVDVLSEKILLALCADLQDTRLLAEAFETVAAKSLTIVPAVELIQIIRDKYWDQRVELAPLVGAASLPGLIPEQTVDSWVARLEPYVRDTRFLQLFTAGGDASLTKAIMERFSAKVGLPVLLGLLRSEDKNVRIKAVQGLKRFNDIGALKLIINQYELEKDPDVRKVYKESFWMIAERGG